MHRIAFIVFSAGVAATAVAGPRAGQIDPTFGEGGIARHGFDLEANGSDSASAFATDSEGRLYLAGAVASGGAAKCLGVMRFSPDGILDVSYASGGTACVVAEPLEAGSDIGVSDVLMRGDGKVQIAGLLLNGDSEKLFVCQLDMGGELDAGFNLDATPGCYIFEESEDPLSIYNGKLVSYAGGGTLLVATAYEGPTAYPVIAKLDEGGARIPYGSGDFAKPFTPQPALAKTVADAVMSSTGVLIFAGSDDDGNAFVAGVNPTSGDLDLSFAEQGVSNLDPGAPGSATVITKLVLTPDSSIIAAGQYSEANENETKPFMLKLTAQGKLDNGFNNGDIKVYNPCVFILSGCAMAPYAVNVDAAGRILLGGVFSSSSSLDMWAMRLRPDGQPDANFGSELPGQTGFARVALSSKVDYAIGITLQGNRVVLAGSAAGEEADPNIDFALVRLADGSIFNDGLETHP